jgi:DNA polymerase
MERDGPDVTACTRCPALVESRSQIVNGTGPADADLMFVGEAPGENEDSEGEPFVGRSGGILDDALSECGLARRDVRISNCIRCRPPENRDPTGEELSNCRDHLDNEVAHVDPDLVITLGKVPSEHLLDRDVAITSEAGEIETVEVGGVRRDVLLCVHPAATLYDRSQRETLRTAIERAATVAGADDGQSDLGDF